MSLQIVHKNSSAPQVEPFPTDLTAGELSVNYADEGAFLTFKSASGLVRRIPQALVVTTLPTTSSPGVLAYVSGDLYLQTGDPIIGWVNLTSGTAAGAGTDLGTSNRTTNTLSITSSTGNAVPLPMASPGLAGLMSGADKTKLDAVNPGTGLGQTDLGVARRTDTGLDVTSSNGAATTLPFATTTLAGLITAANQLKLNGIAAGATVNATDAALRARASHTGTQPVSTITGLAAVATSGSYNDLTNRPGPSVGSDPTGIPGAATITNMVQLSQAAYDALISFRADTLYIING
jgi:hypothetical protein